MHVMGFAPGDFPIGDRKSNGQGVMAEFESVLGNSGLCFVTSARHGDDRGCHTDTYHQIRSQVDGVPRFSFTRVNRDPFKPELVAVCSSKYRCAFGTSEFRSRRI